jgi:TonB-linked SusC/RagA family outer membrane protein
MMKRKMLKAIFLCIFMVVSSSLFAQNVVTGSVKDDTGATLPGVSVVVKGTSTGTVTDIDGKFSLTAPLNATLLFSFVGMQSQEIAVGTQKRIDISMVSNTIGVDEVVVTALGISREKKSLAYSVSEVKSGELSRGGNPNLVKSLDGRVSGVNFTSTSTDPAGSVFVTIRGATSLNITNSAAASQPLFVIDGIPMGSASIDNRNGADFGNLLSQLNPDDIESITVLKGASAGALYGSAAGNGVIMITTKTGKGGKKGIGVNVNSSMFWDVPYNFYETQREYGIGVRASSVMPGQGYDWGAKFADFPNYPIDQYNTLTQRIETRYFTPANEIRMKEFMVTGATRNLNASVSGNYKDGAFRFGIGKMTNIGVMPNNRTDRINANFNAEYNVTKKLKVSVNGNYMGQFTPNKTSANSEVIELLTMEFLAHLQPIKEMQNVWKTGFEGIKQNSPYYKPDGTPYADNPYMYTDAEINTFRKDNFFGKVQLDWEIIKELKFMVRSGIDYNGDNYEYKRAKDFSDSNMRDGKYSVQQGNGLSVQNDLMLMWNKGFNKISTNASLGYNYSYGNSYGYSGNAEKLVRANDYSLSNAVAGTMTSSSSWGIGRSQSFYGTGQVGYANQVFVDVSGRYDWGGILEEDKNHHFYPSLSLSWLPSTTFKLPESINMLKFRVGVAQVGHGIGKPRSNNTFSFNPLDYGSTKIVNIGGNLVDPNIKAEVTTSYEGGFDLAVLDRRISAEFTWYKKTHENQQGYIPTSPGVGYGGMLTNVGTVEAKGYEFSLNFNPVRSKDWNWDLGINFTKVDSKITHLSEEYVPNGYTFYGHGPNLAIRLAEGERIGTLWAQRTFEKMPATSKYAGMFIIADSGTDWKYSTNEKDRQSIGNYNPDFILGMNTSLKWKNLRLGVVGSLRQGGQYVSDIERRAVTNGHSLRTIGDKVNGPSEYEAGGRDGATGGFPWPKASDMKYPTMTNLVATYAGYGTSVKIDDACYMKGVWLKPGGDPNNDADYVLNGADPLATFWGLPGLLLGQEFWAFPQTLLRDATNFKVKEVTLDYTVPSRFTKKLNIENVVIGFVGRNIFQWNKDDANCDPESAFDGLGSNQGIVGKALPSIGSYGFKLSFDF